MRIEPDDGESVVPRREPADRADVRAAAASEHERALREPTRDRVGLLVEGVEIDDERLGVGELGRSCLLHGFPALADARGTRTSPAAKAAPQLWHS